VAKSLYRWGVRYGDTTSRPKQGYFALFTNRLDADTFFAVVADRDLLVLEPIVAERVWK
jgi:hypothetical protein